MNRNVCWLCGGRLIWHCDYDPSGILGVEDLEGQITHLSCQDCKARVEYRLILEDGEPADL